MGKSRRKGNNGEPVNTNNGSEPTIGDMEIPNGRSTITELEPDNPGAKTTLQQNEEKVQEEIADLSFRLFEIERERATAYKVVESQQEEIEKLQNQIAAIGNRGGPASQQIRENLREAQRKLDDYQAYYNEVNDQYLEMNRRIHTLETGFDTGDNREWIYEIEAGEDDHEL